MPTRVCPSCSGGGMAVVVVEVVEYKKKETNGRTWYAVPCAHFLASPTLPGGFPSLSAHLQPHVVVLSCRLLHRVLGLTWRHCHHVAAIPAVPFRVLAVFQHTVDGCRGGEKSGGVGDSGGTVGELVVEVLMELMALHRFCVNMVM